MSYRYSSQNNGNFTVYIYEPELNYLKWLVRNKPDIETGGDLFGLWQDKRTAVVQLILGPGEGCRRTATSFHQDVKYLGEIGDYLTSSQGLCNLGEWHSHHRLGLAQPSHGDENTVWNHLPAVAGGKFVVFIANIRGTPAKVNIGCFLFDSIHDEVIKGKIECLPCPSPVRLTVLVDNAHCMTSQAETRQDWQTYQDEDCLGLSNKSIDEIPSTSYEESMDFENNKPQNITNGSNTSNTSSKVRKRSKKRRSNKVSRVDENGNDQRPLIGETCCSADKELCQCFLRGLTFLWQKLKDFCCWCGRCCCCDCFLRGLKYLWQKFKEFCCWCGRSCCCGGCSCCCDCCHRCRCNEVENSTDIDMDSNPYS